MSVLTKPHQQRISQISDTHSSGADGHVSGTVDYDIFGKPVTETGVFAANSTIVFAYAGKPYDSVTGLSDYGFRDYASGLARFTTVDPIRDGSNWYAYCNSDPVNFVDAWGLCTSDKEAQNNGPLLRNKNGTLIVEDTDTIINIGKVSYKEVFLYTKKGNSVMAFKNISYTPRWQDSTGEAVADGEYSFDLNLSNSDALILNKQIGYNPTEAINTIIKDGYEESSKEEASIAVNKMKNGYLSIKKVTSTTGFFGTKKYFIQVNESSDPIPIDKSNEKELTFYKELE